MILDRVKKVHRHTANLAKEHKSSYCDICALRFKLRRLKKITFDIINIC